MNKYEGHLLYFAESRKRREEWRKKEAEIDKRLYAHIMKSPPPAELKEIADEIVKGVTGI